ncbi:aminoacyl-histidine dipeptidase [Anaerosalibacter massiliensis]|uniref:Cytosol non-specific dipeptidase n=1 Tax=Anaerosalibacter massiliensis TaxID=1347392 RepID=A0A9X2MJA0_9FIRM|nr:aminoacyl-histidine dipeptidase [Anaerosalibacter massiliensis]MCR2045050.1 aminoacyl-histidine dipeptidase [Anaerosalibacter massiliensis]
MSRILEKITPERVFYYFEDLTRIPRCSGEEQNVSNYLLNFAKEHNLEVIQDKALNIIIKKPGTKGYENAPTVVLQGHMDMVCEKDADVEHDFSKDPIKLQIDGDYIKGTGTTLGADNGIAVAMCLAILDSKDIPHPPLEVLATTSEETGMDGANALNPKDIEGKILINIDSEEEGKLLVSCAGGERDRVEIPIIWEKSDENKAPYIIEITGLQGGHSGMEIDEGRGNGNKLMGRLLYELRKKIDFNLAEIEGGAKTNTIPRSGKALVTINEDSKEIFEKIIKDMEKTFKNEFKLTDKNIRIEMKKSELNINKVFSDDTTKKIIGTLILMPNGVQTMSREIEDLVESSNNLGIVKTLENVVIFESSIRSSVRSLRKDIANQMAIIADMLGGNWESYASYPEWEYEEDSYIRKVFQRVYKEKFGKELEIAAIHAGLECGLFKAKFKEMDMVSFGPNMYGVHTPEEKLSISSTKKTWELLLGVLEEIK